MSFSPSHGYKSIEVPWSGPTPLPGPTDCPSDHAHALLYISHCTSRKSNFKTLQCEWGAIVHLASEHAIRGEKDGPAVIFAEVRGERVDKNVEQISALGYEIDGKLTLDRTLALVESSGLEAIVWTTHNHLRESQHITLGEFTAWHTRAHGSREMPTDASVREYCAQNSKYDHLDNVHLVDNGRTRWIRERGKDIIVFDITHEPEHKLRIVFLLGSAINLKDDTFSVQDYKRLYVWFGSKIFGNAFSTESKNPARIHYWPSRICQREAFSALISGTPIDTAKLLEEFERDQAKAGATKSTHVSPPKRSKTRFKELEDVVGQIPPDIGYQDWFKCIAAIFHETDGSDEGAELAHSWSSGDPRYAFEEVEKIWHSLSPNHSHPVTMGTLIQIGRAHNKHFRTPKKRRQKIKFDPIF